jgi:hypothetical protein
LLQAINDYTGRISRPDAVVRFPRGFLRTVPKHRERLTFVRDKDLQSNLAYTMLMSDAVYWLLIRTDVSGVAHEMLVKLFVFIVGTLMESITKEYLKGACGKGFKDRTQYLLAASIIEQDLKAELDWVWDTRNNMHLFLLEGSEYTNEYNATTHTRCVAAFKKMVTTFAKKGSLSASRAS